ncbi:MAG: hypothetical protein R3F34_18000 [Planctomycetota bacterium]
MEKPSSTSSSELRATFEGRIHEPYRPPWGFILSFVVIAAVEVFLESKIPSEEILDAHTEPYTSIHEVLDEDGPAEVAILGASVSWNGLVVPLIDRAVDDAAGRDVTVANYSHLGMRAELGDDLAHVIARRDPPPRILYFGITLHSVPFADELDDTSWAWGLPDFWRHVRSNGYSALHGFPYALQNELARKLRIVQMRRDPERFWLRVADGVEFGPNPMRGGHVIGHLKNPDKTLQGEEIEGERAALEKALNERRVGRRTNGENPFVSEERVQAIVDVARTFQARGTEVVFFEVPLPPDHVAMLPKLFYTEFEAAMARVVRETGARYVPASKLGVTLGREDFKDTSHMNGRGATTFTRALIDVVMRADFVRLFGGGR